ncbi:MAG: cysteine--tRNA ligase [Nanoarchaeota archaeon]
MMALKLFNTLKRKIQLFTPLHDKKIAFYTCGPTVYNIAHIGNFRAFVCYDLLKRYLQFKGYKVKHVMNITDIDDKIIRDCQKQELTLQAFTKHYTDLFIQDLNTLNIIPADHTPKATEYIQDMIHLIQKLIDARVAYTADEGVYFQVTSFKDYGKLANINIEELKSGASGRIAADEYDKANAQDFALWKFWTKDDGNIFWNAPFGKGRPGWHIECSVMAQQLLGNQIDIHMGGVDLIFPHHQNEIAQLEPITKKEFAKYWIHTEHLLVDGKKMSKSLGNFYTLRDLLNKGFKPNGIRYLLLATHYRQKLNLNFEALHAAEAAVKALDEFVMHLDNCKASENNPRIPRLIKTCLTNFEKAMDNDLSISEALAIIHEFMTRINIIHSKLSSQDAEKIKKTMKKINGVLDVITFSTYSVPDYIWILVNKRETARKHKDWKTADAAREKLKEEGWYIEDLPNGPQPRRINV